MSSKSKKSNGKIILCAILIIIAFVVIITIINKNNDKPSFNDIEQIQDNSEIRYRIEPDGTKVNISPKVKEEKKVDDFLITKFTIKTKNSVTQIIANVQNISETDHNENTSVTIIFVDENGMELGEVGGSIPPLKKGETAELNAKITLDFADSYDIKIVK